MIVKDSLRLSVLVRPCHLAYHLNLSGIRFDCPGQQFRKHAKRHGFIFFCHHRETAPSSFEVRYF